MNFKIATFWNILPRSLVDNDARFRSPYCLHRQGDIKLPQKASPCLPFYAVQHTIRKTSS
jgi:hypothetical protein